ncbi:MAG: lipid-binding SYLF domain-containing protein [Bryobacterales bacterium]|nr:lipid-binding SYLF domain-containing protein [Bryobacterales bacterium]
MNVRSLALVPLAAVLLYAQADDVKRLNAAATVFSEVMATPDKAIPQDLLGRAQCVVVVPGVKKAAFIIGGKYGRGFVSCRRSTGRGWSAPASVRVEGGSFGFQIGGSETDVIMLVMNKRGMDRLLTSKFTLGGDASVAAGPVGRSAAAETDAMLTAEILTWSRSRGLFAGISLAGATLRPDESTNKAIYGRSLENKTILTSDMPIPQSARHFVSLLNKYSGRK